MNGEEYPTEEELSGSASAFARLQETYNLDVSEIAAGVIAGVKTSNAMAWDDCFYIGQKLYELGDQNHTQEWLREAFTKFSTQSENDEDPVKILESIANMTLRVYDVDISRNITEIILKVQPDNLKARVAKELIDSLPENFESTVPKSDYKPSAFLTPEDFRLYEAVCRDEIQRSPGEIKGLHCQYVTYNNPFLMLAPFRLEILSFEPSIVMYHNVLYDSEITHIKHRSIPTFQRSTIGASTPENGTRSMVRTSQSTFTTYSDDAVLENLILRVVDMTRQTIEGSEQIQVANYGMGGHYEPHYDCFGPLETSYSGYEEHGDRISTAMFYVSIFKGHVMKQFLNKKQFPQASDVDLGGSTAFPYLRMNVKPVKGSMVFWYNLHASGNKDFRNRHAGCPAIKGSKWSKLRVGTFSLKLMFGFFQFSTFG